MEHRAEDQTGDQGDLGGGRRRLGQAGSDDRGEQECRGRARADSAHGTESGWAASAAAFSLLRSLDLVIRRTES